VKLGHHQPDYRQIHPELALHLHFRHGTSK
jgi:hypothetical protein